MEEYNVMVCSEELIGTAEYMTLYTGCCISRCCYNRVRLHLFLHGSDRQFGTLTLHW